MNRWSDGVHEDHETLASQAGALEAALGMDIGPEDKRVALSWVIHALWPSLELHLRKEEETLFPVLQRLLGENAGALTLLRRQNQELRLAHRHLAELLKEQGRFALEEIKIDSYAFIDLLEDHEKKVQRLLLDVLEFSLGPKELAVLAQKFQEIAQRAHEEEGWPDPWRSTRRPSQRFEREHLVQ